MQVHSMHPRRSLGNQRFLGYAPKRGETAFASYGAA